MEKYNIKPGVPTLIILKEDGQSVAVHDGRGDVIKYGPYAMKSWISKSKMDFEEDETCEKWLSELDKHILESLKQLIKKSWDELPESREDWIRNSKSQVVNVVSMIRWTEDVED